MAGSKMHIFFWIRYCQICFLWCLHSIYTSINNILDVTSHQSEWPSWKNLQTINARECWEKGTLLHCWWECKLVQPLWRTAWKFLKTLKVELPYHPAVPLLGIYLKKTIIQKESCTPLFIAALFAIFNTQKQPKYLLTVEWIKKTWCVCVCVCVCLCVCLCVCKYIYTMEYYSTIKKNEIMPFVVTWMDLEIIILGEVRWRKISYNIIYMWNLKKELLMNLFIKQKQTHRHREWTYIYQGRSVRGRDRLGVWDWHIYTAI